MALHVLLPTGLNPAVCSAPCTVALTVPLCVLCVPLGDEPYKTVGQRNETIIKGMEVQLATVYLLHELDEAAQKMRDNKLSAATGEPLIVLNSCGGRGEA